MTVNNPELFYLQIKLNTLKLWHWQHPGSPIHCINGKVSIVLWECTIKGAIWTMNNLFNIQEFMRSSRKEMGKANKWIDRHCLPSNFFAGIYLSSLTTSYTYWCKCSDQLQIVFITCRWWLFALRLPWKP